MGGGVRDNFIVVDIDTLSGEVDFEIVALNYKNSKYLGDIDTYRSDY